MSFAGTPRLIAQQRAQRPLIPAERQDWLRTTAVEEVDHLATCIQRIECKFFLKSKTCVYNLTPSVPWLFQSPNR